MLVLGGRLGLACDDVETGTVDPQTVRWRDRAAARPWLAGIEPATMSTLLDPAALVAMIDGARRG